MKKHSVRIADHSTSITLEPEFWDALKVIATRRKLSINDLTTQIDESRGERNLSSATRVFILDWYKKSSS